MQGEVNPLFKKFVHEGDNPTTYIPADKRREIYDYMSKTNFTKHLDSKYPDTGALFLAIYIVNHKITLLVNFCLLTLIFLLCVSVGPTKPTKSTMQEA